MTAAYVLSAIIIGLLGFIAWKQTRPQGYAAPDRSEEIGRLQEALEAEKAEKSRLQGQGRELSAAFMKLEAKYESLTAEHDALKKKIAKHEAEDARREKEFEDKIAKLEAAKISLEQERQRVIREDEETQRMIEEERDRIWANHETNVIATLTELCKQPQYAFSCFTNTNLPEGFEGSLKPDFMIEFLDQYIIFDAKKSKSESLQTYIANTVKTTVAKVKKNPKIATTIYLVVPTEAIGELKTHYHPHDGYMLYVVSPESLAPILASLKRITAYDKIEGMDPQQREALVNFVADLDIHVSMRNSADIILSKLGAELLEKAGRIDPAMAQDIAFKKQEKVKNLPNIMNNVFKKLVASAEAQSEEIDKLVSPKAPVRKKDLEAAQDMLIQKLL